MLGADKRPAERMRASTLRFATSRPTTRVSCGILPLPPCSCARARSHAHATVRVEEDARPAPRFSAGSASGGHGLKCATGGCWNNRPFADFATLTGHEGARAVQHV